MSSRAPTTNEAGGNPEDTFRDSPLEKVRTLYAQFLQGLFYASPPGAYHWEPNEESEIVIGGENPIHASEIGRRPAITLTRGPVQFYTLGMDDMLSYDPHTGTKKKSVLVPGTMLINCCSRVAAECERLAWICGEQLWLHRELLMRAGFFEIGRQPSFGAPSPAGSIVSADSGDEWYVVTVTCPFQFYRTSQVSPLGESIVNSISMALRTDTQLAGGSCGGADSASAEPPFSVVGCPPGSFAPDASDVNGGTPNAGSTAPVYPTVPHPLNPAQQVHVRAVRPNCPAVKPPSIGGRTIPISTSTVEESCGKQTNAHVSETSLVKV